MGISSNYIRSDYHHADVDILIFQNHFDEGYELGHKQKVVVPSSRFIGRIAKTENAYSTFTESRLSLLMLKGTDEHTNLQYFLQYLSIIQISSAVFLVKSAYLRACFLHALRNMNNMFSGVRLFNWAGCVKAGLGKHL